MSIYTDMIKEIQERGSTNGGLVNEQGCVCLLGAYAYAKGWDVRADGFDVDWPYKAADKELIQLRDAILNRTPDIDDDEHLASRVIWKYNDRIVHGRQQALIKILEEADALV